MDGMHQRHAFAEQTVPREQFNWSQAVLTQACGNMLQPIQRNGAHTMRSNAHCHSRRRAVRVLRQGSCSSKELLGGFIEAPLPGIERQLKSHAAIRYAQQADVDADRASCIRDAL